MFAHQVIEDLKKDFKKEQTFDPLYRAFIGKFINEIKLSQQFHLGDMTELIESMPSEKGKKLFRDHSEFIRFPYKICWFDYVCSLKVDPIIDIGKISVPKRGVLIHEIFKDLFSLTIFNFRSDIKQWTLNPCIYIIKIGSSIESKDFINWSDKSQLPEIICKKIIEKKIEGNGNIYPVGTTLTKNINSIIKTLAYEDVGDLSCINTAILLLNCKNIRVEKKEPSEKLNRCRIKENKQPLFTYHTLSLKLPSELSNEPRAKNLTGIHQRIHFCRGHFKSYTKERPLFGRISGLWWWQAQVRGQRKGSVMKDYSIKAIDERTHFTGSYVMGQRRAQ